MYPDTTNEGGSEPLLDEQTTSSQNQSGERREGSSDGEGGSDGERAVSEANAEGGSDDGLGRRGFLRAAGATAAAAGGAVAGSEETDAQEQVFRFGGEVAAWNAREPAEFEGDQNPTIELQAGTEYEFWFENIDGEPHNMTIQDDAGSNVEQSTLISAEGETASVTFTATPEMTTYICTIHPATMVGDLEVVGGEEGGGDAGGGIGDEFKLGVVAAALVIAFVSPLLFAMFLFSRRGGRGGGETPA